MKARHLPQTDYRKLKAAGRDLIEAAGGNTRACQITRATPSRLSEAVAPQCDERFMAIDQVADLEADTGQPFVTRALADMAGFDIVAREPGAPEEINKIFAKCIREVADITARYVEAFADGKLAEAEMAAIRREVDEALDEMHALKAALERPRLKAVP